MCRAVYTQRYFRDLSHAIAKTKMTFFWICFYRSQSPEKSSSFICIDDRMLIERSNRRWALVCHHFGKFDGIGLAVWCDGISQASV
ncbi:hypothetical protein AZ602_03230 [Moraxella sp. RCAD0137]|nr:hypothetical protein AZ602_03230 [Moraxella sp. RCAD0137]